MEKDKFNRLINFICKKETVCFDDILDYYKDYNVAFDGLSLLLREGLVSETGEELKVNREIIEDYLLKNHLKYKKFSEDELSLIGKTLSPEAVAYLRAVYLMAGVSGPGVAKEDVTPAGKDGVCLDGIFNDLVKCGVAEEKDGRYFSLADEIAIDRLEKYAARTETRDKPELVKGKLTNTPEGMEEKSELERYIDSLFDDDFSAIAEEEKEIAGETDFAAKPINPSMEELMEAERELLGSELVFELTGNAGNSIEIKGSSSESPKDIIKKLTDIHSAQLGMFFPTYKDFSMYMDDLAKIDFDRSTFTFVHQISTFRLNWNRPLSLQGMDKLNIALKYYTKITFRVVLYCS